MKRLHMFLFIFLLAGLVLSACAAPTSLPVPQNSTPQATQPSENTQAAPQPSPTSTSAGTAPTALPQSAASAVQTLADQLNVQPDAVEVVNIEAVDWPDSCLGVSNPGEMCAQVITPGYRIQLKAGGQTYEVHTDQSGKSVRVVNGISSSNSGPAVQLPALVARAAINALSKDLNISPADVKVVSTEQVQWPNSCLGVEQPGVMCASVVTPGYRVILSANGQQYEFHTTLKGEPVVQASGDAASQPPLVWEQTENGNCSRAEISASGVLFGACSGQLKHADFITKDRAAQLQTLLTTYAPFTSGTPAGTVQFAGQGSQSANDAAQRSIADWSKLVFQEVTSGRSGAAWDLVIGWHREGGIAGFCDDMAIYSDGFYTKSSCKGQTPTDLGTFRLTDAELTQLYTWMDTYANFELIQKNPNVSDDMPITMTFSGSGTTVPTAEQKQAVAAFAADVFAGQTQ